jgi:hypothetical protein
MEAKVLTLRPIHGMNGVKFNLNLNVLIIISKLRIMFQINYNFFRLKNNKNSLLLSCYVVVTQNFNVFLCLMIAHLGHDGFIINLEDQIGDRSVKK